MATIQIKRNKSNATTKPTSLLEGELAINLLDRSLYSNDGSSIVQLYTGTSKWFDTSGNANNANKLGGVAASSYATQTWVEGKKYLTAIPSEYITETELNNTLGRYQSKITSSNKLAYSLISGTPTLATVATSGKYSDLSGVPTSLPASDVYAWAKKSSLAAADVPNLDWSKITSGKPTTLDGYGITNAAAVYNGGSYVSINASGRYIIHYGDDSDWRLTSKNWAAEYKILHSGNYSSYALPLSGGTITGPLYIDSSSSSSQPLALRSNAADASGACRIQFIDANNAFQGYVMSGWGNLLLVHRSYNQIGVGDSGIWCSSDNGITKNALIHSGNIGNYALKTDGSNAMSAIAYIKWNTAEGGEDYSVYGNGFRMLTYNASTGDYRGGISIGTRYGWQLVRDGYTGTLQARFRVVDTTTWEAWKTIAFTDSNVASATKLQTARNIWGQSFDGTGNVSGGLADVTSILFNTANGIGIYRGSVYSGALTATDIAINGSKIVLNPTGNVLIGTTTDNGGKLQVAGGPVKVLMASSLDDAMFYGERKDLGYRIGIGVGASTSRGIYDTKIGWCFKIDTGNNLSIVGHTVTGNLIATGDGVFGSDARYKSKIQDLLVDLTTIANAPVFNYKWTDREDDKVHLGTTAQYWLNTDFKDAVDISNKDFFHLNYGALGVAIGVSLAKKTVNHEERIKALEKENKELKNELKQLKQWHN